MVKRLLSITLCIILLLCLAVPVFAEGTQRDPRVVDQAELLTASEQRELQSMLDEISERQKVDVVIVTASTLGGKSPQAYADDYFDYHGYGFGSNYDGILLLVSMEDRDWWISTCGFGIKAFTDAGIDYISEQFLPYLSDGDYADAFKIYAEQCDAFITSAKNGNPYDRNNLPKEPYNLLTCLVVAILVGFTFAFIVTAIMRGQLKSVRPQPAAANYVRQGSMNIRVSRDLYLYSHTTRREKPKDSGGGSRTHRSSSGRSHGGGGGKF